MYKKDVILTNETGLHARPAVVFVKTAKNYEADIKVIKDNKEYNGKSPIGILSMAAKKGDQLTIIAEGLDEKEAVDGLVNIIEENFGE